MSAPLDGFWPVAAVPLIALLAYRLRAMSAGGASMGSLLAVAITWGLGWRGLSMLATLLVVGTLVSDRSRRGRGARQAICNGGAAAALALAAAFGWNWGGAGAAGALAAALSDTVAGEVGQRWRAPARLLLFGPRVPPGVDGAMSLAGTAAGLLAALPIPLLSGGPFLPPFFGAVAGNLADSILGATVQRRLGRHGNDLVNLAATVIGSAITVATS